MKTLSAAVIFVLFAVNSFAAVNLHISNSTASFPGDTVIRIHNIEADINGSAIPGKYWIDFQWNPSSLVFTPVNLGAEPAIPTPAVPAAGLWTGQTAAGEVVTFIVSQDGTNLTTAGSPLPHSASFQMYQNVCGNWGYYWITSNLSIYNNKFELDAMSQTGFHVVGQFESDHANIDFSYSMGSCSGTTHVTAYHQ